MLLPVPDRPGWLQSSDTQELWVPTELFCKIARIIPNSLYTAKSIHSPKYRFMKLGGRLFVNWTQYQAQARLCIAGSQTRRLPCQNFVPRLSSNYTGGDDAREIIARIQAGSYH